MQLPLPEKRAFDWFRVLRKRWRGEAVAPPWCRQCGYSVQALESTVCPECGSDLRAVGILDPRLATISFSGVWTVAFTIVTLISSFGLYVGLSHEFDYADLPGSHVDWVSANMNGFNTPKSRRSAISYAISINGKSSPRWRWSRVPRQTIRNVKIEIEIDTTSKVLKQVYTIDLLERTYQTASDQGEFTHEMIRSWFEPEVEDSVPLPETEAAARLIAFIESISDGTLAYAGHHGGYITANSADGREHYQIHYFNMTFNGSRTLWRVAYWVLVSIVLFLGIKSLRVAGRKRRSGVPVRKVNSI